MQERVCPKVRPAAHALATCAGWGQSHSTKDVSTGKLALASAGLIRGTATCMRHTPLHNQSLLLIMHRKPQKRPSNQDTLRTQPLMGDSGITGPLQLAWRVSNATLHTISGSAEASPGSSVHLPQLLQQMSLLLSGPRPADTFMPTACALALLSPQLGALPQQKNPGCVYYATCEARCMK